MTNPVDAKKELRAIAAINRVEAAGGSPGAAHLLTAHFQRNVKNLPSGPVSGFMPIRSEIVPMPLLACLRKWGRRTALPIVGKRDAPLIFRLWVPGDEMNLGPYGIQEPKSTAVQVCPCLLLVPMLAFDRNGFRLGYGGGYYDRTLAELRAKKKIVAVGIAYSKQEVDVIPATDFDQRLDWIVTEREAIEIGA